jgi:hypothetical protein
MKSKNVLHKVPKSPKKSANVQESQEAKKPSTVFTILKCSPTKNYKSFGLFDGNSTRPTVMHWLLAVPVHANAVMRVS